MAKTTSSNPIDPNDKSAVMARAAEIQAEEAQAAQAERVARYAPLVALVDGPAFAEVRSQLVALRDSPPAPGGFMVLKGAADMLDLVAAQVPGDARPATD